MIGQRERAPKSRHQAGASGWPSAWKIVHSAPPASSADTSTPRLARKPIAHLRRASSPKVHLQRAAEQQEGKHAVEERAVELHAGDRALHVELGADVQLAERDQHGGGGERVHSPIVGAKQIKARAALRPAYGGWMSLQRRLAALFLAATLSGGVLAQGRASVDDETIFVAVAAALESAPSLAGADIEVKSRDGVVTLTGFAATMAHIAAAGRLAARVHGVSAVDNKIRVANRPSRA